MERNPCPPLKPSGSASLPSTPPGPPGSGHRELGEGHEDSG